MAPTTPPPDRSPGRRGRSGCTSLRQCRAPPPHPRRSVCRRSEGSGRVGTPPLSARRRHGLASGAVTQRPEVRRRHRPPLRRLGGLSLDELANRSGVTRATLYRLSPASASDKERERQGPGRSKAVGVLALIRPVRRRPGRALTSPPSLPGLTGTGWGSPQVSFLVVFGVESRPIVQTLIPWHAWVGHW
jgi:hypothetical protein